MSLVVERGALACPLIRSEIVLHRACRASDKDSATETAVSDYNLTIFGRERERIVRQAERGEMIDQSAGETVERMAGIAADQGKRLAMWRQ